MKQSYLAIPTHSGLQFVDRKDVLYCLSEGSYTHVYCIGDKKLTISKNLKEVENTLADPNFVRIHHSHLINLAHTVGYINNGSNCVQMSNGEELAVARNRKKAFLDLFDKL